MESNLQERKIELIQWLSVIDDVSLLDQIDNIKEQCARDWWDEISDVEKGSVFEGIIEADAGKLKPHSDARSIYEKWL